MREIKFRAWDAGRRVMWYKDSKTVDGNEIIFQFFASGIGWGIYDSKFENRLVTGDPKAIFNTPGTLMQFTGMLDRNEKEVYEGDIVLCYSGGKKHTEREIKYMDRGFVMAGKYDNDPMDCIWYYDFEVIGNIYQKRKKAKTQP